MLIRILTVGKPENDNYKKLFELYHGRIKHYTQIETDYIRQEKIKTSEKEIFKREEQKIWQKINTRDHIVVLDKSGKTFSSPDFSDWLGKQQYNAVPCLTFVIGGPLGLSREFVRSAQHVLSFSPMTFPHELAAVVLLEQIYRAFTIQKNEKYHK